MIIFTDAFAHFLQHPLHSCLPLNSKWISWRTNALRVKQESQEVLKLYKKKKFIPSDTLFLTFLSFPVVGPLWRDLKFSEAVSLALASGSTWPPLKYSS